MEQATTLPPEVAAYFRRHRAESEVVMDEHRQPTGEPVPDYIPEEKKAEFPGLGFGWAPTGGTDFIPDAAYLKKKSSMYITSNQEKYGIEWKPGDPLVNPRRGRKGGLNPFTGEWMNEEEIEKRGDKKRAKKG